MEAPIVLEFRFSPDDKLTEMTVGIEGQLDM
jgi:hypothetical protein